MGERDRGPSTSLASRRPGPFFDVTESLSDVLSRRLLAQRVVLLHGPLDDLSVTRVAAELMTLDAEGDDPVTLRVDCGEAALAPALTLMDVIELMGVPVRALCLGQVGGGAVGVVAVCAHRAAMPSTRVPQGARRPGWRPTCATWPSGPSCGPTSGTASASGWPRRGPARGGRRGGPGAGPVPERGRGGRVRHPRRGAPARSPDPAVAGRRAATHGVPAPALTS